MATKLSPYLSFNGNTREAFSFYEECLGGKITSMMSYNDMPATASAETGCSDAGPMPTGEGIMHACLELPGGALLMAGDTPPGMPYEKMSGVMMAIDFDSVEQATGVFEALGQGGQVTMPLASTFWAKIFGMVTDQFGVSWAVNGAPIAFEQHSAGGTSR